MCSWIPVDAQVEVQRCRHADRAIGRAVRACANVMQLPSAAILRRWLMPPA